MWRSPKGTAIFPGAVIRGDVAKITIGKYFNIQDNAVLHGGDVYEGDELKTHLPVEIGDYDSRPRSRGLREQD